MGRLRFVNGLEAVFVPFSNTTHTAIRNEFVAAQVDPSLNFLFVRRLEYIKVRALQYEIAIFPHIVSSVAFP